MAPRKQTILQDHKRVGKQLIPPLLQLGNFQEVSYINTILPETIWLAILNECYGNSTGAELSLEVVKIVSRNSSLTLVPSFITSFEKLEDHQRQAIKTELNEKDTLKPIQIALQNLINVYPGCPLNFLVDEVVDGNRNLGSIKALLEKLLDKRSKETTFMLVNVIYHLFCLDRLQVTPETSLARLPEIQHYPNTEISQQIASAARASINTFMHPPFFDPQGVWNGYFWNRGLELEPIKL